MGDQQAGTRAPHLNFRKQPFGFSGLVAPTLTDNGPPSNIVIQMPVRSQASAVVEVDLTFNWSRQAALPKPDGVYNDATHELFHWRILEGTVAHER